MAVTMSNQTHLSNADERIINSVFDPENSPDSPSVTIDTTLPSDSKVHDSARLKQLQKAELGAVRLVEQFSVESTSAPNIQLSNKSTDIPQAQSENSRKHEVYLRALELLTALIAENPDYASAYNNRAQLRRWRYENALLDLSLKDEQLEEARVATIKDLETAIALASPPETQASVSPAQAKLLSQAWTQRGAVFWGITKRAGSLQPAQKSTPAAAPTPKQDEDVPDWQTWDNSRLEEEGSRSFFMAGMYGSEIGRNLAVRTNPYARLCAGIVKEAMRSEFAPM
ncbi:hypothetical protein BT63DRAFT_460788 [Microthyrium microscopicum]|uniref:Uncharacterized protein n=1 Tax=Microthyrium microscopicum TaxID=703497 RepID=A0A6A6TV16_9PEZI|nr:hypothetical protein BT63DRAFT_460788 [Microthyrium microscopicum]